MQFSVYTNMDKDTNKTYPYFVDVQTDLLDVLNSRVVVPLAPVKDAGKEYPDNLCPTIEIDNKAFALLTHQITTVSANFLKKKKGSCLSSRSDIVAAVDFLITGI